MMTRRRCTCAVTVGSNMIYVIGGHDGAQILNTIEKYETERFVCLFSFCFEWDGQDL